MAETLIKVRFELDASDWHGHGSETLWAKPVTEDERRISQIRNSPFFSRGINNLDTIRSAPTKSDGIFRFIEIIERGGHSTYMLISQPADTRVAAYWNFLEELGCAYES